MTKKISDGMDYAAERLQQLIDSGDLAFFLGEGQQTESGIKNWISYIEKLLAHYRESECAKADLMKAVNALGDITFECDGVVDTESPSLNTYNKCFLLQQKLRQKYAPPPEKDDG